ncbi:hypothetical protein NDI43_20005 [Microcoleus vaginatus GB2-A3]|uniref:hypothetical protein n=1 Tax=Microcoleus vaginatus TaxID=119532 RepID=UPI0032A58805
MKIFYLVLAGLQFFIGLEKFGIEKKGIDDIEGSSATDSVTDVTDVTDVKDRRKFGNGFCNGCNGCQEEGRRKFVGCTMRTG